MNDIQGFVVLSVALGTYFLPTIAAIVSHRRNTLSIATLNLFLGWTFVFWVLALVWAFKVESVRDT